MQSVHLSKADSKVLAQVFDPESGPAKAEIIVDSALPADRHIHSAELLLQLKALERSAVQLIEAYEKAANKSLESKVETYDRALRILDDLIEKNPDYASARNNRAQLRRWRFGDRSLIVQNRSSRDAERTAAAKGAVADLQKCISTASPPSHQDAVSPAQGQLLAQAYTQLGALYYAAAKNLEGEAEVVCEALSGRGKDALEEEASRMFYLGGLYGNEVAKALAVHINPHAKLCGNIVKEAMRKEMAQV